jgi:hypothetical protein
MDATFKRVFWVCQQYGDNTNKKTTLIRRGLDLLRLESLNDSRFERASILSTLAAAFLTLSHGKFLLSVRVGYTLLDGLERFALAAALLSFCLSLLLGSGFLGWFDLSLQFHL